MTAQVKPTGRKNTVNELGSAPPPLELHPGVRVEAQRHGSFRYSGVVEIFAPQLGVVWIREDGAGERVMLGTDECTIRIL